MKNIFTFLLFQTIVTMSFQAYGQTIGLKAGFSTAGMLYKDDYSLYSDNFKNITGFMVGADIDFHISDWLSFEPGLQISRKGYKYDIETGYLTYKKGNTSLYYLEIPALAKGAYNLGKFGIYGVLGPSFGIGIAGQNVDNYISGGGGYTSTQTKKTNIEWGKSDDIGPTAQDFKRGDLGLIIGGGILFNQIQIGLVYNAGLSNLATTTGGGRVKKNRVLGIILEYRLKDK